MPYARLFAPVCFSKKNESIHTISFLIEDCWIIDNKQISPQAQYTKQDVAQVNFGRMKIILDFDVYVKLK